MAYRDIVVIGASAGSMEALLTVASGLPAHLSAAVLIVLHIPAYAPSKLREILKRVSSLPVVSPQDGDHIVPGHIYVPTPDRHLLAEANRIRVTRGPKENRARPSVDVLFRSAAYSFGPRVTGIVLSGNLGDGTAGLWAVKDRGGIAIVQSPDEAQFPSMPKSALEHVEVDYVLPVADMAATITRLVQEPIMTTKRHPNSESMGAEIKIAMGEDALRAGTLELGTASSLTCPECHGVLMEIKEGPIVRYRCHTGHGFSSDVLFNQMNREIDTNIWNALRAIDEQIILLRKLEQLAKSDGDEMKLLRYHEQFHQLEKSRQLLRETVTSNEESPT